MIHDVSFLYYSTLTGIRSKVGGVLDKDAFLQLLIQELKSQNPLEPMETKDMIAQLSQLTSLEQVTNLTKAVEEFVRVQTSVNPAQLASLVGKYVVVKNNTLSVANGQADGIVFYLEQESRVIVRIEDENGNVVRVEDLGYVKPGMRAWQWNARDNNGIPVRDGKYVYHVYRVNEKGELVNIGGIDGGTVSAVQIKNGKAYVLVNGNLYPVESIVEIS